MRFLVDAQLPPALARLLVAQGHHAEHVVEVARADAPDREIWDYAIEHAAAIVTKDEDFADMVLLDEPAPFVVWVRVGNTRKAVLLEWFVPSIERIIAAARAGDRLIELR